MTVLSMYIYVHHVLPSTLRSQKGTTDSLELELMRAMSHHKHRPSARTSDLNC